MKKYLILYCPNAVTQRLPGPLPGGVPPPFPPPGKCEIVGTDDQQIVRGFNHVDAIVAQKLSELPAALDAAVSASYRRVKIGRNRICEWPNTSMRI